MYHGPTHLLGVILSERMREKGISVHDLCNRTGMSTYDYKALRKGKYLLPFRELWEMGRILGMDLLEEVYIRSKEAEG